MLDAGADITTVQQRLLAAFSGFCNHFRPRRHLLTAVEYRVARHAQ